MFIRTDLRYSMTMRNFLVDTKYEEFFSSNSARKLVWVGVQKLGHKMTSDTLPKVHFKDTLFIEAGSVQVCSCWTDRLTCTLLSSWSAPNIWIEVVNQQIQKTCKLARQLAHSCRPTYCTVCNAHSLLSSNNQFLDFVVNQQIQKT